MTDHSDETENGKTYEPGRRKIEGLNGCLTQHERWLEDGAEGSAPLVFRDADLRGARLSHANLRKANLEYADLTDAFLNGADLSEANLSGANFADANLCGATLKRVNLEEVKNLTQSQLGGTDLTGAKLSEDMKVFPAAKQAEDISRQAQTVFFILIGACVLSWLTMEITTDAALLGDGSTTKLPLVEVSVPHLFFFLATPLILLCLHLYFHCYLQNLWRTLTTLPAKFPDGGALDLRSYPWLMLFTVRSRIVVLSKQPTLFTHFESLIGDFLAWGLVPITLFLFFLRCLCLHSWKLGLFHAVLLLVATGFTFYSHDLAVLTLYGCEEHQQESSRATLWKDMRYSWRLTKPWTFTIAYVVLILYFAVCFPVTKDRTKSEADSDSSPWIDKCMYANLDNTVLSFKPADWNDPSVTVDEKIRKVKGAVLKRINLRNASARKVFLVNATLTNARLDGACFLEADLRAANLNGTSLILADLRNARMNDTHLQKAKLTRASFKSAIMRKAFLADANAREADFYKADLSGAFLDRADLNKAKFNYANMESASLIEADLADAEVHGAFLTKAVLTGARLNRANLGESHLESADLRGADLRRADLRKADLQKADLSNAKLRHADLRQAKLGGAVLAGADLREANLTGADLRASDLKGADLRETALQEADLYKADLRGALLGGADLRNADLSHADLRSADCHCWVLRSPLSRETGIGFIHLTPQLLHLWQLNRTGFKGADCRGADFSGADLRFSNFPGSDFAGADFTAARVCKANFADADLRDVLGTAVDLRDADLTGALLPVFKPPGGIYDDSQPIEKALRLPYRYEIPYRLITEVELVSEYRKALEKSCLATAAPLPLFASP